MEDEPLTLVDFIRWAGMGAACWAIILAAWVML